MKVSAKVIYYRGGYKYQLCADYAVKISICPAKRIQTPFITLEPDGSLLIKNGYAWDGPSGPTWDTKTFMRGSLVHDALYQLARLRLLSVDLREQMDRELRLICLEDGMSAARAWWVYQGVRYFGKPCAASLEPPILKAP